MATYTSYTDGTYGSPQRKMYLDSKKIEYVLSKSVNFANQNLDAGDADVLNVLSIPANTYIKEVWLEVQTAAAANATVDVGDGTDVDFFGNGMFLDATGYLAPSLVGGSTWDAATIADGNEAVQEFTVNGAALGDHVVVSSSVDVADLSLVGQVTAADTVTAQLGNWSGGNLDLASATFGIVVVKSQAHMTGGKLYTSADTIDLKATTDGADVNITTGVVEVKAICRDMKRLG